jgi:hypothetical protein
MSGRRWAALGAASLLFAGMASAPVSLARFTASDTGRASFGTDTLRPPTDLAAGYDGTVSLAWTPSASGWASGYEVLRSDTSGSGYGSVGTVTPVTTAYTTDSPALGTWHYVLRTTFHNWTSVRSNEASVVVSVPSVTTPITDCTTTAAETSGAGDNNGYESNPGRGCVQDGLVAQDANSGTSTTNSCTSSAKDKHRFWGYTFGLPATVTSINGITVTPRISQSNNGGTTWLCIQLSSDSGASWTSPKQVLMGGNSLTTYTLGSTTDAWGRSWTVDDLGAGFRVRVIDSSTQSAKDFRLDSLGIRVTYTP